MLYHSISCCIIDYVIPHTCHILPPSEIDIGLCLAVLQAQEGNIYFAEWAERVEYGNYYNHIILCHSISCCTIDYAIPGSPAGSARARAPDPWRRGPKP